MKEMKRLFWRLILAFGLLFTTLLSSFAVSLYLKYEQNYSQLIFNIDQRAATIGEVTSADLEHFITVSSTARSVVEMNYRQALNFYRRLTDEELKEFLPDIVASIDHQSEYALRDKIIHAQVSDGLEAEINRYLLSLMCPYRDVINVSFLTPSQAEAHYQANAENIRYIANMSDSIDFFYIIERDKEGNELFVFYLREAIEIEGSIVGYLLTELVEASQLFGEHANTIHYFGDVIQIRDSGQLSDELIEKLQQLSIDEATYLLRQQGFHIHSYLSPTNSFKVLHYTDLTHIHRQALNETLTVFELAVIFSMILFVFAFYLLFKSVIKPCYLLVDYVKKCGERDYSLPPNLNDNWRQTFNNVRNAYLENERLLAVKDNQSEELQFAWKRAIIANQAKTHFLAKVSHELKTPLNAIKGYIQLLKLSIEGEKQRKQLDIIDHSSELLVKLVNELLDFSVIEDGKVKLQIESFNFYELVQKVEELFIIQAQAKNLNFEVTVDSRIPHMLYGDDNRIKQIIINLLSNAIKFTDNGYIKFSIDLDYQNEQDAFMSIKVQDSGKGIDESKFATIFESFVQENNSISRHFGGTGLGLSISKVLAEAMGGNLTVESTVGVGSTFTFFLPLSKYPPE